MPDMLQIFPNDIKIRKQVKTKITTLFASIRKVYFQGRLVISISLKERKKLIDHKDSRQSLSLNI